MTQIKHQDQTHLEESVVQLVEKWSKNSRVSDSELTVLPSHLYLLKYTFRCSLLCLLAFIVYSHSSNPPHCRLVPA